MREKIEFEPNYGDKENMAIIKVIGVGGGGGNAVRHMYSDGIVGVDFLICNTDRQALENNRVPSKLVLGESGLGAGARPDVAKELALESRDKIVEFIGKETKMLFITAGMGKGTGTGAAPVIAQIAKEMGILTIGVVTFPFSFEGELRAKFANAGIDELRKYVDSLIVIKNQNIIKYYNDEDLDSAFGYADDVLKNAVKCIAELITVNADQNIDFNDIETIMKDSGEAMLGLATAQGENRIEEVVEKALSSPLLNEDCITNANNFLFFISYGKDNKLKISELEELTKRFEQLKNENSTVIWGRAEDPQLGDAVKLSVIVTNYKTKEKPKEVFIEEIGNNHDMSLDQKRDDLPRIEEDPFDPKNFNPLAENKNPQPDTRNRVEKDPFDFQVDQVSPRPIDSGDFSFSGQHGSPSRMYSTDTESNVMTQPVVKPNAPQMIRDNNDLRYENNDAFSDLVNTPAILRQREVSQDELQDMMIKKGNPPHLDDDMHAFFKDIPD